MVKKMCNRCKEVGWILGTTKRKIGKEEETEKRRERVTEREKERERKNEKKRRKEGSKEGRYGASHSDTMFLKSVSDKILFTRLTKQPLILINKK